jgi:hypothetical protein
MKTVSETLSAATLLHSLGCIVYERKNPILKDCIILEPAWLASLVAPLFIQEVYFGFFRSFFWSVIFLNTQPGWFSFLGFLLVVIRVFRFRSFQFPGFPDFFFAGA